jgi:hypothetical protein
MHANGVGFVDRFRNFFYILSLVSLPCGSYCSRSGHQHLDSGRTWPQPSVSPCSLLCAGCPQGSHLRGRLRRGEPWEWRFNRDTWCNIHRISCYELWILHLYWDPVHHRCSLTFRWPRYGSPGKTGSCQDLNVYFSDSISGFDFNTKLMERCFTNCLQHVVLSRSNQHANPNSSCLLWIGSVFFAPTDCMEGWYASDCRI